MRACVASSILPLLRGAHQFGRRCSTVRCPAVLATSWIVCTPVAPVPSTATRLWAEAHGIMRPLRRVEGLTAKALDASMRGRVGADSKPIAVIRNGARWRVPSCSLTSQLRLASW